MSKNGSEPPNVKGFGRVVRALCDGYTPPEKQPGGVGTILAQGRAETEKARAERAAAQALAPAAPETP